MKIKPKECPFCDKNKIKDRIFYEKGGWIAFLDARPYVKGHTVLSAKRTGYNCPEDLVKDITTDQLESLGKSLQKIFRVLKKVYAVENIAISSLRGNIKHFHFHLIPIHTEEEKKWRLKKQYKKGHLFEFLGDLEKIGVEQSSKQRIEKGWNENDQHQIITQKLQPEIKKLRKEISYQDQL